MLLVGVVFYSHISYFSKIKPLNIYENMKFIILVAQTSKLTMSKTAKTAVPTNSTTTSSKISSSTTKISCTNYAVPDPRPFFEREPIQLNLPRRLNIIDEDLFKRLRSLRLLVLATARNVEEYRLIVFVNISNPLLIYLIVRHVF